MEENRVKTVEYRIEMQKQLAQDFWFMNYKQPEIWREDFDWADNCVDMEWGNGWLAPFYDLCQQLLTEVKSDFQWVQLKEKFGEARCYYNGTVTEYGKQLIDLFERDMGYICEYCGREGKIREGSWLICLCDECYNERRK